MWKEGWGSRRVLLGQHWGCLTGDIEDRVNVIHGHDVLDDMSRPQRSYPENFLIFVFSLADMLTLWQNHDRQTHITQWANTWIFDKKKWFSHLVNSMILLEIYDPYGPKDKKELTQSEDLLNLQPFEIWKFGDYPCDRKIWDILRPT